MARVGALEVYAEQPPWLQARMRHWYRVPATTDWSSLVVFITRTTGSDHAPQAAPSYWIGNNRLCTPPPAPAGVDFTKEMLVYASIGKRMSPRDSISIDGSGMRNDSLLVVVRRFTLKDGCPGPQRATYPQSLVKLPADRVPVRFSEVHIKIPCEAAGS